VNSIRKPVSGVKCDISVKFQAANKITQKPIFTLISIGFHRF
jgi:hypothetical protein